MNRSEQLAQRRLHLQARSAVERDLIASLGGELEGRLSTVDRVLSLASAVARHPLVSVAAIGATIAVGPWRILRLLGRGAFMMGAAKRLYSLVGKFRR